MLPEVERTESRLRLVLARDGRHASSVDTRVDDGILIWLIMMLIILVGSVSKGNRGGTGRRGACG